MFNFFCKKDLIILDSLKAGVIGDAMGVPFEFGPGKKLEKLEFLGEGIHEQLPGTWSDDTALTICTIDFLYQNLNPLSNLNEMAVLIHKYVTEGLNTPDNEVFDVGNTIRNSSINFGISKNYKNMGCTSERSNGNGALMRILPVSIYNLSEKDINKRAELIDEITKLTHNTDLCVATNILFSELIRLLYFKKEKNNFKYDNIFQALDELKVNIKKSNLDDKYKLYIFKYYSNLIDRKIHPEDVYDIENGGYVLDTFNLMIIILFNKKNLKEAVLNSFEIGGDTDTLGTLVAQLGVFLYHEDLNEYFNEIRNNYLIKSKIHNFSKFSYKKIKK